MKEGEWNKCCCCFYISPTEFGTWGRKRLVFHWIELVSSMVKDWCVCDVFRLNTHLVFWVGWTWGSVALYSALCIKQTALKCLRPVSTITAVIYHRTGQRTHHLTKRKISTTTDEHEINRSFPQTPKHRYFFISILKDFKETWVCFFSCSSFTNVPGLEPPSKSVYTGSIFWPLPSLKCCINSERADSERPLHFCFSEVSTDDTTQHSQGYMTSAFSLLRVSHFTCNRTEIEAF